MNKQTFDFLRLLLLNSNKNLSICDLCQLWDISSRTFYNYWNDVLAYLSSINAETLFDFDGKKISFLGTGEDKSRVLKAISCLSLYEYRLSSFERRTLMVVLLATNDKPITNNFFGDMFFVSRNTIINDLKIIENDLSNIGISIDEYKHLGTLVKADEYQRRKLLFCVLKKIKAHSKYFLEFPCDPCVRSLMSFLRIDRYYSVIEKVMRDAEKSLLLNVTDEDFYQMLIILAVCIGRISGQHYLTTKITKPSVNDDFIVFARYVFKNLTHNSSVDDNEINFYVETVHSFQIISRVIKQNDNPEYVSLLIHELLNNFDSCYALNLTHDDVLEEYLTAHIIACYHRIKQHQVLSNPYLSEIKENYCNELKTLKKFSYILENGLNISLSESELAYILMHILASIERNFAKNKVPNILIVCSCGVATGNYLATQINKHFNANIIGPVSVHQVNPVIEQNHVDLIVSTVPYDNPNIPTIVTNLFISTEDINAIQSILSANTVVLEEKKDIPINAPVNSFTFCNLLSEDTISLHKEASDWKEAIIAAGELLLWNKSITVNYLQQMINLVVQFGPYIVVAPGVALAHASPSDGAIKASISIIRLDNPVKFGKDEFDPISIVIACAVNDNFDYSSALLQLMEIIRRPDFYNVVMSADGNSQIIDYFIKLNKSY